MSACDACLRASLLRSEGLTFAETRFSGTLEATRLLRMPPEAMIEVLRREQPLVDEQLEISIEGLLRAQRADGDSWMICRHDPRYPAPLACFREASDIPAVIYGVGEEGRFEELCAGAAIAIVGARRASAYGREVAYSLANEASAAGVTVVSGMALGVDGAAHRGALQGGGRTIAVLAGGPELAYPRSHRLLHEQIRAAGCVVSENPPGSQARRWAFVARNRVIAALALMTVFVEGSEDSGAMHTVGFADELGTAVGAVPGPVTGPMSAGPNALLHEHAAVAVRGPQDIFDELELAPDAPNLTGVGAAALDPLEQQVLDLIAAGDRAPRAICESLPQQSAREIARVLGRLEMRGRIVREPSGEYGLRA